MNNKITFIILSVFNILMNLKDLFNLLRVRQWYKNLMIFIPLIFSVNLFSVNLLIITFLGFIAFCLMSSATYIINDLFDFKKDKINPLKSNKPLVSGRVNKGYALKISLFLMIVSLILSLFLPNNFYLFTLTLLISTFIYSIYLKNIPIMDLLLIGFNFCIRTVSGAFLINVRITNWLVLIIFIVALLLGLSKRYGLLLKLDKKAIIIRPVFKFYTKKRLIFLINLTSGWLLIIYCFYCFLINSQLIISIPFFFLVFFRYLYLVFSSNEFNIKPELLFQDVLLTINLIMWILIVFRTFY